MLKVVGASWLQTKISTYVLAGMGILAVVSLFIGEIERIEDDGNFAATVYWSQKGGFKVEFWGQGNELAEVPRGPARGYYRSDIKETGWSKLEIETDPSYPDWVQAYSAGVLEGALTWQVIHWQWQNTIEKRCDKYPSDCKRIREILKKNMEAVRLRSSTNEDTFWHQITLFYHQLDGMNAGYDYAINRNHNEIDIPFEDFLWLNSFTDVTILERVLNITNDAHPGSELPGLAAAFIRLSPDVPTDKGPTKEKIIVGHNAAGSYNTMLRILKRYKFNFHKTILPKSGIVPGSSIEFAGYPGAISSQDDMYCVSGANDHRLTVTGTAINNFNPELWPKVNVVDHALIGPRVMAANRLSNSGIDWVRFIARINSGTAPAQWSILNLAKLALLNASNAPAPTLSSLTPEISAHRYIFTTINGDLKSANFSLWRTLHRRVSKGGPGLLWTAEQVPGLTHGADQSIVLRAKGYWADYGIPHYQDIRDLTGIRKMEAKHGEIYSLTSSPRAILFKNDFETAVDVESVQNLMRSNHYINTAAANEDILALKKDAEEEKEINPVDIVSNSNEVNHMIQSLKTVKSHVEDGASIASILTSQEQQDIMSQVNEILKQLSEAAMSDSSDRSSSESDSKEDLNLESNSMEEIEDKVGDKDAWHGLGARGDLHGWLGEEIYGLLPLGVIDTKVFNTSTGGMSNFVAISGPAYSQTLEKPVESLLTSDTREKSLFGFSELLQKFRQNSFRFISDSEEDASSPEDDEPLNFEDALYSVVNKTIQIYAPNAVPPFEWSDSDFENLSHSGQPNKWRFEAVELTWVW